MKRLTVEIKNETEILMLLERELSDVSFGSLDRGNVDDVTNWSCFSNNGTVEFFDASNNFVSIISSNPTIAQMASRNFWLLFLLTSLNFRTSRRKCR